MDQDATSGAPQDPQSSLNDPQTRRKFLRTAVIGAAGVAGGTAVAGVILSRQSPGLLTGQFALGSGLSLHDNNCSTCLTGSGYDQVSKDPNNSSNYLITVKSNGSAGSGTPGTLFFWFTAPGLTGGSDAGGTQYDLSFTYDTSAFDTKGSNPFYRDVYSDGSAPSCPTQDPNGDSSASPPVSPLPGHLSGVNDSCVSGTGCVFPYTVPQNQTQDVQFHAHLVWDGTYPGSGSTATYTFTFSLTTTGQTSPVCTGTITVTVKGV